MKKLRVLLIRPYSKSDELTPPLGLGYLATVIRKRCEVEILDGLKEKLNLKEVYKILKKQQYDIIGIQVFTFQVMKVRDYVKSIREILPEAKIILGGPHPSCSPSDIFQLFPSIDWAFKGEAEIGLERLLDLIAANKELQKDQLVTVPGLIWKTGSQTVVNQQQYVEDLDTLGNPSWDLLRPDSYPVAPHGSYFKNYPIAPMIITRGCPYSCTYCAGHLVSGKKTRFRSVQNAIEEIKLLYHQYGIREIHIEDDNFTFNHEFVKEFCRRLKENNLNITWACPNGIRLDSVNEDLLLKMKDAGLYSVSVGIESGSERILKKMKKNLSKEQIEDKINMIRKCGLDVGGFFIIGYPTETLNDIRKTIEFSLHLDLKKAAFFLFKPFPGTEATRDLIENGELGITPNMEWDKFILANAVYAPPGLLKSQIIKLRKVAILRFYFRFKIIINIFREIKNMKQLELVLKRTYSWLIKAH